MEEVFIECQMLILNMDGDDLKDLVRIGRLLECDLAIFWTKFFFLDGHLMIPMVMRAYGDEIVAIFREAVQHHAQIMPYVGSENLLEACGTMDIATDMRRWFDPRVPKYIWGNQEGDEEWAIPFEIERVFFYLKNISRHNQRIAQGLPFWATGIWEPDRVDPKNLTLEHLKAIVHVAESHSISLFYRVRELPFRYLDVYLKISDYSHFDVHLNTIQRLLCLKYNYWRVIYSSTEYCTSDFSELETYPHLTHETIPAFLDAIKPYLED
jgi:hypothetical protein